MDARTPCLDSGSAKAGQRSLLGGSRMYCARGAEYRSPRGGVVRLRRSGVPIGGYSAEQGVLDVPIVPGAC